MKTPIVPQIKARVGRPAGHIKYAADGSIRWSLHAAAREFNVHRERLARRQRVLGIEPGEDGCFSTKEIIEMIHGGKEAETIRLIAAQRLQVEMRNREAEDQLIPTATVAAIAKYFCPKARRIILATSMTDEEKAAAVAEMNELEAVDWTAEAKAYARKRR